MTERGCLSVRLDGIYKSGDSHATPAVHAQPPRGCEVISVVRVGLGASPDYRCDFFLENNISVSRLSRCRDRGRHRLHDRRDRTTSREGPRAFRPRNISCQKAAQCGTTRRWRLAYVGYAWLEGGPRNAHSSCQPCTPCQWHGVTVE